MAEGSMDCMHMPNLQESRQESHEMECCQEDGASISSLEHGEHGVGECCSVSSQDSPEAIPQTRIASPDPLQISSPCEDVSAQTVAMERDFEAIQEKPRPATALLMGLRLVGLWAYLSVVNRGEANAGLARDANRGCSDDDIVAPYWEYKSGLSAQHPSQKTPPYRLRQPIS